MRADVSCLAFALQLTVCTAITCPAPFKPIFGVCLYFKTEEMTWCNAQAFCSSVGGELVRGSNFPQLGQAFFELPGDYWIGLTDFLLERGRNRDGWKWTDGASEPASSGLVWKSTQPNDPTADCVRRCQYELCDSECNGTNVPVCQPRLQGSSYSRVKFFRTASLPVGLASEEFAQNGGCSRLVANIEVILECAVLCSNEEHDWCVSFYFNKARRECRLVLYTDATIDMGDARGWVKFATLP